MPHVVPDALVYYWVLRRAFSNVGSDVFQTRLKKSRSDGGRNLPSDDVFKASAAWQCVTELLRVKEI